MKGRILIMLVFQIATHYMFAQSDSAGIYMTANDYLIRKLAFKSLCRDRKHRMRLNKLFGQSFVTVFDNGKKRHMEKSEIFGFHDCESKDYRFFNNHEFIVIRRAEALVLYAREILQPKGKGVVAETFYFFSNGVNGEILPLTINDLRFAFPDNWRFHELLDKQFSDDESLIHYDSARKEYQVIATYYHSKNYY